MKKLLGILVLGLLLASSNLFAENFKLNKFAERSQRARMSPQLGIIDKKTKKTSTVLLPKTGAICSVKIVE